MAKASRSRLISSLIFGSSVLALASSGGCSAEPDQKVERARQTRAKLTTTIPAERDSHVREGTPNQNFGATPILRLQSSGHNRALVRFDPAAITNLAAGSTARLKLTISDNGENWGTSGRSIAIHRLTTSWSELGVTWNCAIDSDTSNSQPDCSAPTAWEMAKPDHPELHPWIETATATATITNTSSGVVEFDVSSDVELFRSGTPNYGWIIKKVDEGAAGRVEFASRETSTPPVLEGTCPDDDDSGTCNPGDAGDGGSSAYESGAPTEDSGGTQADSGSSVCVPENCDDGQECTLDECSASGCVHISASTATPCSDGNTCTTGDHCDGHGTCQPGTTVTCSSPGPCAVASCDPAVGCTTTPLPAGTSCESDGTVCNGASTCDGAGNCQPGTPLECVSTNPCVIGSCDPASGCLLTPAPAGTPCGSGVDMCSATPTCNGSGVCEPGTPITCTSTSACMTAACDPSVGCVLTPVADGTPCDSDMNACNGTDRCQAGACAPGTPLSCTSTDPCLIPSCDPLNGCTLTPAPNGTPGCAPTFEPPPLDPTVAYRMADATAFLYSGTSPVQTGVAAGTIDPARVGVVRGRVLDTDGVTPKGGVTVTVVGHPEFGQTLTRADGEYDLAVNGGTTYVVNITRAGYITLQRQASVGWHGWAIVDDLVLTQPYTSPDLFVAGSPTPQVVRGFITPAGEDADGARQAVIVFPENTHITNFAVADGTPLEVQLTELTRGPQGPQRMPGELPPTSGYTYAFEVSFPAATAAGVRDVQFDRDVAVYVDNFTHYPVGETVPLGFYNQTKGAWMADKSGRIVKILTTTGGIATLDVTGDGVGDTGTALADLGITTSELQTLAAQYAAGTELWRATMRHFSQPDMNWGFGGPPDAKYGPNDPPQSDNTPCNEKRAGSIIGCESRTLGEEIPIVGTPFSLHYQSNRTPGFWSSFRVRITDDKPLPTSLVRARIEIRVAGTFKAFSVAPPIPPDSIVFLNWDGRDAYKRDVGTGTFKANIRVGYEYPGVTNGTLSFGSAGSGGMILGDRVARTITLWREYDVPVERFSAAPLGLGGWTLDAHHLADVDGLVFHRGDGEWRSFGSDTLKKVETVAGVGYSPTPNYNDNGPATQAFLGTIDGLGRAADGTLYIAADGYSFGGGRVRRVGTDGIITTIAGLPPTVPKVDGGPALHAAVFPTSLVVGADGTIFFAEYNKNQVWKIKPGPTPTLHLVAGNGLNDPNVTACPGPTNCGDGGDARAADLARPTDIAVAGDGTLFIADYSHARVRRVGPEGTITTYASIPESPLSMSLRSDGMLYVIGNPSTIVTIDPSGRLDRARHADGSLVNFFTEWCQQTTGASGSMIPLPDDSFVLPCHNKVGWRSSIGEFQRIAGPLDNYNYGFAGDGGPALRALFSASSRAVLGENGEIFVADRNNWRIRHIGPPPLGATNALTNIRVPNGSGSEVYEVDLAGRHVRTLSGLTGAPVFNFGWDAAHRLASIIDSVNNETKITRSGDAITITAPHGQVTTLSLDASGYLTSITNPAAETTFLAHGPTGLLTDLVDPRGQAHHFEYNKYGRLAKDVDAVPNSEGIRLESYADSAGWKVEVYSPEGRLTSHRVDRNAHFADSGIVERRTHTQAPGPSELVTTTERYADGATSSARPDGTKVTVLSTAADPRWGTTASYATSIRTDVGFPTTTHSMTRTESRSATLANPGDPLSVSTQTVTTTMSGAGLPSATTTRVFTAAAPATWTTTSPAGRQSRATLDSLDRVTSIAVLGTDPVTLHPVLYHYDERGRIDQITQGSRVYTTTYDPTTGWVESTTDPAGLGVSYAERDPNSRPKLVNLPGGRALAMSYDRSGNLVSITPPSKPAHGFSWDPTDRVAAYAPPDLGFLPKDTSYTRDKDGLLLRMAPPDLLATFTYDELGRTREITGAVTNTMGYDPQGRLTTIATSDGVTLTYSYDGSLVTQQAVSGPFSHAVNKQYDNFFRLSSWNLDGFGGIAPTYDTDGFVSAVDGMTLTRGNTGLLKSTTLGAVADTFTYNAYGEVVGHSVTGSATSYAASYTRDAAGRIESKTETIGGVSRTERYTYDGAGRLWQVFLDGTSIPLREYTYDANGNRSDGTYDAQDRLLTHGDFSFLYGSNGELQRKTDNAALTWTSYGYDVHGNLRTVLPQAPLAPIEYVIDGLNRRIGKKVGGSLVQGFVYDGPRILAELDGNGSLVSFFRYVTDGHSPDFMRKNGVTYRFIKDHLGSPRLVVDAATGAVAQRMDFDEWGNVTTDTNPGFQPFGFAGGLWDRDTNLVRFGARDYDSATGRWTTKDVSRFGGGLNFYGYAKNDPLNFVDPTGREPWKSTYSSKSAAAYAALTDIWNSGYQNYFEFGGYIYRNPDGSYSYSDPTTDLNPYSVSHDMPTLNQCAARGTVVGRYHNHPGRSETVSYIFSGQDAKSANDAYNNLTHEWVTYVSSGADGAFLAGFPTGNGTDLYSSSIPNAFPNPSPLAP